MALQTANYLSGRIENIIFYKSRGKYFARSMPVNVKQTMATKTRSSNFGIASAAGSTLRGLLMPVLPFPKDRNMQNRFSGAIAKWLARSNVNDLQPEYNLPYVQDFNFNAQTSIAERWKIAIAVTQTADGGIAVHIPAFVPANDIIAPAHTTVVLCTVVAAWCRLKDGTAAGNFALTMEMPYNQDVINEQTLSFPVVTSNGHLVITAASFRYVLAGGKPNENISFIPSSVIDVRYC